MDTKALRKGYLDGPWGQIHYYEQGPGEPLVLLHQSPVCARMFERAMPHLAAAGLRAIAVDTPGYGNSDVPPHPPAIEDYADCLHAVLDGLGLASAHILGHHTGAMIAGSFAARNPGRVRSLILNGTPIFTPKELEVFAGIEHKPMPLRADGSHLQEAWERRLFYSAGWRDVAAMHRRLVDELWAGDTSWYGHHAAFAYDVTNDLEAITVPTLLLTNTGDDIYHLAKVAHRLRPDFTYAELIGGTHDIVDEQPEEWSAAVANFIL